MRENKENEEYTGETCKLNNHETAFTRQFFYIKKLCLIERDKTIYN